MDNQDNLQDNLYAMRHSMAHILASAIQHLWPKVKFGVGPVVDNGFYYDVDISDKKITEDDLKIIEQEMKDIIKANQEFLVYELPIDQALKWAKDNHQPYKEELLNDLSRSGTTDAKQIDSQELGTFSHHKSAIDSVTFYTNGDFTDLCRGPHVASTGLVGVFSLQRISGAYWRGLDTNPMMQRIYGISFYSQKELDQYLEDLEKARKRDHRKIGQELDLFVISDLIGPGLPLFTPRGTVLRQQLIKFSEELQQEAGYEAVWCPHITRTELYKVSGHFDKYPERFMVSSTESDDVFMMKPMNCPHVTQIYAARPRSYRELPIRYMETTTMYRDEKSGELHGLSRVRSLTQDDSHAFVRVEQIESEMRSIINMVKKMYQTLGLLLSVDLSFRDSSDRYFGEREIWQQAENIIKEVADKENLNYKVVTGEAAFYGPKIDIYVADSLKRRWQCATIQVDFIQPERFDLNYIDETGTKQRPVMIHKAILGSLERFIAVYIEHTAGHFPIWLSPEQIRFITLNQEESTISYVEQIARKCRVNQLRISVDNASESVGKKIRKAEMMKIPYIVVIGNKEITDNEIMPRIRKDLIKQKSNHDNSSITIDDFIDRIKKESQLRVNNSRLYSNDIIV